MEGDGKKGGNLMQIRPQNGAENLLWFIYYLFMEHVKHQRVESEKILNICWY